MITEVALEPVAGSARDRYFRLAEELSDPSVRRLVLAANDPAPFWTWYADVLRGPGVVEVVHGALPGPTFPEPTGRVGLWLSGRAVDGLESAVNSRAVAHLRPDVQRDSDHPLPGGLNTFRRAVIAAERGTSVCYLGLSLDQLASGPALADGPAFIEAWNEGHLPHRLRSACADLTREQVLRRALDEKVEFSDCERGADWCGDCLGCFETFYAIRAIGRKPWFRLTDRAFSEFHDRHYQDFIRSGFRDNHRGAMQRLLCLHVRYGIHFDRADACNAVNQEENQ